MQLDSLQSTESIIQGSFRSLTKIMVGLIKRAPYYQKEELVMNKGVINDFVTLDIEFLRIEKG